MTTPKHRNDRHTTKGTRRRPGDRATAPWLASATASDGIRHFGRGKYMKSRTGALARFVRTPDA